MLLNSVTATEIIGIFNKIIFQIIADRDGVEYLKIFTKYINNKDNIFTYESDMYININKFNGYTCILCQIIYKYY